MNELIEALTELAREATFWLQKQNGTAKPEMTKEESEELMTKHIEWHRLHVLGALTKSKRKKK